MSLCDCSSEGEIILALFFPVNLAKIDEIVQDIIELSAPEPSDKNPASSLIGKLSVSESPAISLPGRGISQKSCRSSPISSWKTREKKTSSQLCKCFSRRRQRRNGGYSQKGHNLGDSPTARALQGNLSTQRSLPHLAKHFFPGFLFLLWAKKASYQRKYFLLDTPSFHNADFCFNRSKWSEKGLREPLRLASVGNLWRSREVWRRYFGKTELISMQGVTLWSQGSQWLCVFNLEEVFLFVSFDSRSGTMESWTSAAVSNVSSSSLLLYTYTLASWATFTLSGCGSDRYKVGYDPIQIRFTSERKFAFTLSG